MRMTQLISDLEAQVEAAKRVVADKEVKLANEKKVAKALFAAEEMRVKKENYVRGKSAELYRYFNKDNTLLYIGESLHAVGRACQHRAVSSWYFESTTMTIERFDCKKDARAAERIAIKEEKPLHNIVHNNKIADAVPVKATGVNGKEEYTGLVTKKDDPWAKRAKEDRMILLRSVVYKPLYRLSEAAEMLCINATKLKELAAAGEISVIIADNLRMYVTGWALIDYLENMQKNQNKTAQNLLENKVLRSAQGKLRHAKASISVFGFKDQPLLSAPTGDIVLEALRTVGKEGVTTQGLAEITGLEAKQMKGIFVHLRGAGHKITLEGGWQDFPGIYRLVPE